MENDSISPSSSESKLPLIVGILAFALGAAGLVLGLKAKSAAEAAGAAAQTATSDVAALGTTVSSKATKEEVQAISGDLAATKAAIEKNEADLAASIAALQKVAAKPAPANGKSTTPPGPGEHSVAKGETLSGIAKKAGISLKALQDLNPGVDATKLRIGQKLKTK
jgi:LysM repeat protein